MWLASFDLLLGARSRSFAAAMLIGCSGCGDQDAVSDTPDEGGYEGDAAVERLGDARLDDPRGADTIAHPADGAKPDVFFGDEKPADVSTETPKLALCLRLMDPQDPNHVFKLSQTVSDAYVLLVNGDCRVKGAVRPDGGALAFADWRNALYQYNPALWGCVANPPTGFALLSTAFQDLSRADVAVLIELYLRAATTVLALAPSEAVDLRSDLQRLAGPLVTNESADYTFSTCTADAGAQIDAPSPSDASGMDAHNEAGPADADASSVDADGATRDSGVDAHDAGGVDVDEAEASQDASGEPAADTTEQPEVDRADAAEETMDASDDAEGGDN